MRFKKPRGLNPQLNPGQQGRLGSFGRGQNMPPSAAQLGSSARYSSGVIDFQSNSTSSLAAGEIAAAVGVRLAPTAEFVTIEITATDAAGAI